MYLCLDNFLKFGTVGLHILILTINEFRGKGYKQSETLLEGANESSSRDKIRYRSN